MVAEAEAVVGSAVWIAGADASRRTFHVQRRAALGNDADGQWQWLLHWWLSPLATPMPMPMPMPMPAASDQRPAASDRLPSRRTRPTPFASLTAAAVPKPPTHPTPRQAAPAPALHTPAPVHGSFACRVFYKLIPAPLSSCRCLIPSPRPTPCRRAKVRALF